MRDIWRYWRYVAGRPTAHENSLQDGDENYFRPEARELRATHQTGMESDFVEGAFESA